MIDFNAIAAKLNEARYVTPEGTMGHCYVEVEASQLERLLSEGWELAEDDYYAAEDEASMLGSCEYDRALSWFKEAVSLMDSKEFWRHLERVPTILSSEATATNGALLFLCMVDGACPVRMDPAEFQALMAFCTTR